MLKRGILQLSFFSGEKDSGMGFLALFLGFKDVSFFCRNCVLIHFSERFEERVVVVVAISRRNIPFVKE